MLTFLIVAQIQSQISNQITANGYRQTDQTLVTQMHTLVHLCGTLMQATLSAGRIVQFLPLMAKKHALELLQLPTLTCTLPQQTAVLLNCHGSSLWDVTLKVQQEKESQPICTGPLLVAAGRIVKVNQTVRQRLLLQESTQPPMNAANRQTLGLMKIIVNLVPIQILTRVTTLHQVLTCGMFLIKTVSAVKIVTPHLML